jgi:beta-glucosidase
MTQPLRRPGLIQRGSATFPKPLVFSALGVALLAWGCASRANGDNAPQIEARAKSVLTNAGHRFKDSNGNGTLEPYEDWRLSADERARDLVSRMTLDEKAGMMLIDTLNALVAPNTISNTNASRFINDEKMTRFVFRNAVSIAGTPNVTPQQAAEFTNAVQEMAEATRLGIPALFKSNTRNHYERNARQGINEPAGSFSEWPKEAGLAATRDMALIKRFADTIGEEWSAIGLRGLYGYMADLSTEPRWYRVHETFTEDADLCAEIMTTLVKSLQGGPVNRNSKVALTIKHFPGGGPQEMGLDPHYTYGKNQVYPAGNFGYHLKPFRAAIDAGVSAIMPYYGVPIDVTYEGVSYERAGMAFSKQIVTDLLRNKLGFRGYVNSDTGIINQRAWGLENKTVPERVAAAINAGIDILSGFNSKKTITGLINAGSVSEARVDQAVKRLLVEQFELGLFEDPYVDANVANSTVGKDEFRQRALDAQRKSIVLLRNQDGNALPLRAPTSAQPVRLYTMGLNAAVVADTEYGGYSVASGDRTAANGNTRSRVPAGTDYVVIRVEVTNPLDVTSTYRSDDQATGGRINPATRRAWGADDPDKIDNGLRFGGSFPWEADMLTFSQMANAQSWQISPPLLDIQAAMKEVGDPKKVILSIYFRQPYVLDDRSRLKNAGGIVATFGVSDNALMDVLTGKFKPQGKLPFALANTAEAITRQDPDAPGYAVADTLYPFGFGLTY